MFSSRPACVRNVNLPAREQRLILRIRQLCAIDKLHVFFHYRKQHATGVIDNPVAV
jgi:hypothetical protein